MSTRTLTDLWEWYADQLRASPGSLSDEQTAAAFKRARELQVATSRDDFDRLMQAARRLSKVEWYR